MCRKRVGRERWREPFPPVRALPRCRPDGKVAASAGAVALAGSLVLAACSSSFERMAATECAGIATDTMYIATDTVYEDCRRDLARPLADAGLGDIVRSQTVR
jgi:hypothetical protein